MPYWFNVTTRTVEAHDDAGRAKSAELLGPYETEAEARTALDLARRRTEEWDTADREWEDRGADPGWNDDDRG